MTIINEVWLPVNTPEIPALSGFYSVSNKGRVRNEIRRQGAIAGRIRNPSCNDAGYPQLCLRCGGMFRTYRVHRLVMMAFVPNPENKSDVNHKNGVRSDNRLENLEWATRSENSLHAFKFLPVKSRKGEANANSRLSRKQVVEIRAKWATGRYFQRELGEEYGVTQSMVSKIILNANWVLR